MRNLRLRNKQRIINQLKEVRTFPHKRIVSCVIDIILNRMTFRQIHKMQKGIKMHQVNRLCV